ncbi:MAG: YcaO-like family protein [Thermoactinospora sp.]|nr:YcaO-like family protein [Thermoactinospora sp.]
MRALTPDRSKVRLPGTDRASDAAATLAMARAAAPHVGITRVADITRLDTIGIPTFQAIRPASRTLAVSQGKGVTADLARLSAMMEAIELWHAEQPMAPAAIAPPCAVTPGYDVRSLPALTPNLLHDRLPMEWARATSLTDGSSTLVPLETVQFTLVRRSGWSAPALMSSTNGLASGNTVVEATLHALYEIIERDAVTMMITEGGRGTRVDPATLGSPVVDELCELIARAAVRLEVRWLPSPTGLPCLLARVSCDDYPTSFMGYGCHLSSEIALTRAVTEAAQARLAYISGARDDLHADAHQDTGTRRRETPADEPAEPITAMTARPSLAEDLDEVVRRAAAAFRHDPLAVDLTRPEIGVPVVRVVAPGSRVRPEVF